MALANELLEASKHDQSMTKHEKLFVHRCAVVKKYVGFDDTPTGQALKYSCSAPVVGVTFYAGKDLGSHSPDKIAAYVKNEFAKNGMVAEVFIKDNHQYGSTMAIIIDGGRFLYNPVSPSQAAKSIKSFASEAKLIFFSDKKITSEELKKWVEATDGYIPELG